ncbi:MAG: FkbM family methyltransferase [Hyphomicrobiaceae bacterium]|nr:FkbM family methyltransferase [Hyphomicrobiaceae bacterium]
MPSYRFVAPIPITVECPEAMQAPVDYVFRGEYESHHDGTGLDILDVGANVGSFALWASLRWPSSRITSFEPNPGTFELLKRNTAGHDGITIHNAALFPGGPRREKFFSRYAGDGEAGLQSYAGDTFIESAEGSWIEVDVVDPATLPSPEIVKLDIEGGEASVLAHLDLSRTVLVLAEFQNRKNRDAMRDTLAKAGFEAVLDEEAPWDPILDYRDYRRELKGDIFGRMFYRLRGQSRMTCRRSVVA